MVVTNQSGIARGLFTEEELYSIHSALVRQLSDEGVVVDALYYCPHLPEAAVKAIWDVLDSKIEIAHTFDAVVDELITETVSCF